MKERLVIARAAATAGGAVLSERRDHIGAIRSKGSRIDMVTETDIASGVATVEAILRARPSASIIVEEPEVYDLLGIDQGSLDEEEVWLVDPLDGTTSFIHGYPCYSVAVACVQAGVPVVGAILNGASGELISAAVGLGAHSGESPIGCSAAEKVTDALVITGFPYDRGAPLDRQLAVLAAFLRAPIHGMRRDGSAAVDCTHVAAGRADGFWEYSLKPWDMAAGAIICREAGAVVTDVNGRPWDCSCASILAANPALHAEMLELIGASGGFDDPVVG